MSEGDEQSKSGSTKTTLPTFPGETFYAHAGVGWLESAESRLAGAGLLHVARGELPAAAKRIVDVDLALLPELPASHKEYERRKEKRIMIMAANQANAQKRFDIVMQSWTDLFSIICDATEKTAPVLTRTLRDRCVIDIPGSAGGFYDGPRAWRITLHKLSTARRDPMDKQYYRNAERLPQQRTLCPQ